MAAIGSITLASCGSSDSQNQTAGQTAADSSTTVAGPQPLLDSMEVIKAFRAEPKFKAELLPARRFYRERGFKLGWFKNHQPVERVKTLQDIIAA